MSSKLYYNENGDCVYMFECAGFVRVCVTGEPHDFLFDTEEQAKSWMNKNGYNRENC